MKIIIWLGCILVYSALQTAFRSAGIILGGIPTALLALVLVFLPAPLLCKAWSKRKEKQEAIPRQIVVDTSTGEVVGPAKSRAPVIVAASVLAVALVVCVSMYVYIHTRPVQEPEPQQTTQAETDKDRFLNGRAEAWEDAEDGVTYFVGSDGNRVFIPEKYRDNPQEWIDQVGTEIGDDQGSYDHWRALYDAGAIEDTYEQWVDITEQQGFSVREYAKAKDEWSKMHDAGETDMSFEEWWELLK